MRTDPFTDSWLFLTGQTGDHDALGPAKYLLVILFLGLLAASIWMAQVNWSRDPSQRTAGHVFTWIFRLLIGSMWFQASIWKLPLPVSEGLTFWTKEITTNAAFQFHRQLAENVLLPYLHLFNPLVYMAELFFAVSLLLGFAVRLSSLLAIPFTLHIWLGLYHHPSEWPWLYIFLVLVHGSFIIHAAGRSLGLDAILRRERSDRFAERSLASRAYRAAS